MANRDSVNPESAKRTSPRMRIAMADLPCKAVAAAANISPSLLSHYLAGRRRDDWTRERILAAFNRLAGESVAMDAFWTNTKPARRRAG